MQFWKDKLPSGYLCQETCELARYHPGLLLPAKYSNVICEDSGVVRDWVTSQSRIPCNQQDLAPGRVWLPNAIAVRLAQRLKPGALILDAGCGSGRDAVWLAANGFSVVAIDNLASSIELTQSRAQIFAARAELKAECCDCAHFEPDHQFDAVLQCYCDFPGFASQVRKWLRPGGMWAGCVFSQTHRNCFGTRVNHPLADQDFSSVLQEDRWERDRHCAMWLAELKQFGF